MEVPNDLTFDIQDPKPAPQPVSPIEPPIMAPPQEPAFVPQMTAGQLLALEDIAAGQQQQQRDLELFRQAVGQNPEMHAKKVRLAGELGLDPNDPDQDWKIAEEASRQKQAEAVAFNQKYPHLASRMKEYDFAAQAFDDLENLQKIEGLWQYMTENYSRGKMMVERGQIGTRIAMGWSTQADLDRLEEMRKVPRLPKMDGLLYGVAGGTSEVIGQMGQTIPTSLAAAGTAAAVGAVAPPLAVISAPTAFLLSSGVQTAVIEGGNAYLDYLDSGYGEEEARNAALGVGIINGAAETVLGKYALKPFQQLSGRLGSKVMPKVFKPQTATTSLGQAAMAYLKGVGAEVGTEVFQEIVQIAGGEAAKAFSRPELDQLLATPQGRQQMYDRIGEIASKTVLSMMVLGLPGPMANFVSDMQRAEQANIDTQVLTALQKGTNDSRLTERNPELARQFQEQVQGETVSEVYINADTLRSRLIAIDEAATAEGKVQKSAFDVLRDLLPDVSKQLDTTAANSDAIVIKTSDMTTKLGGSDILSVLMGDIRIDPYGMSQNEVVKFSPQIQKQAGEMRKSISKKAEEDKAWRESANRVRDMQAQQIQQAGRSAMEARVAGALYSIIAQRMAMLEGVTPEQWHATRGMTTAPLGEQAAPAVQPPAWLSQMAAPAQAQPTQEMAPAEPQVAPAQQTVQPLDQAKTLLADPNAQITPEQRAELEQYVQQAEEQPLRSITPEQDTAYLAAVEAGDMETAQRMVDEAAKARNGIGDLWHSGTFDPAEDPTIVIGPNGMHFGTRHAAEDRQAGKPIDDFIAKASIDYDDDIGAWFWSSEGVDSYDVLSEEGFATEDAARKSLERFALENVVNEFEDAGSGSVMTKAYVFGKFKRVTDQKANWQAKIAKAKEEGYSGLSYVNLYEDKGSVSYVIFSPGQAKSADPVTRDAQGNVIPLSQRFDQTKESILYSQQPDTGVGGTYNRMLRQTVLNPNARATTWFHELMHFMFDTHADMIARGVATDQMRADFMELLRFAGFNGTMEEYLAQPNEKQRVIHETIAYSWESWLLEGKSPSDAVASIFEQIRKFFVEVWKQLSSINAAYRMETGQDLPGMTDNVRAVFGRMVASEDQIKLAEATRAAVPLFLDKGTWVKMGNPADDWDKYQDAERRRIDEAVAQLTRKSIAALVRLQGSNDQRMAQLNKEAMALREELREQATAEVALERVMRTREFLETGRVVNEAGEVIEEKAKTHKINREAIVQMPLAANVVETDLNQQVEAARMEHDAWMSQDIRPLMRMPEVRASGSANVKQTQKQITTTETKLSKLAADAPERAELQAKLETLRAELAKRTMVAEERSALEAQKEAIRAENDEIRKTNAEIDAGRRASKQKLEEALAAQAVGLRKIEAQKLRAAGKHKLSDFLDEEGMDPAQLADLFQYSDVAEMLTDLLTAPDREKAIEQEIDRRMLEEYSELATPEAMQEAVSASLANDHNTQWLTMELNALRRAQRMGDNRPEALQEQGDKQQLLADMRADLDALNNRLAEEREASDMAAIAATQSEIKSLKESIAQVERDAEGALSMRIMRASARKAAEMVIANRTVRSVRPDLYAAAERRSSREALAKLTDNDLAGAIAAKRDQLLQNQMVYEATQVRAFIARTTKWYNSLFKRGKKELNLARTRSMEYVNAIRAILLAYGFGESNETRANREARVRAQLAQLQQYEPARYAEINSMIEEITTSKRSYKDLTVQEFKRLNEQIRFLWAEAERDKSITSEGKRVQVAEVEDQIAQRAAELAPKGPRPGQEQAITRWERTVMTFQGIVSSMRRAQSLFDSWDGKLPGVFTKYFWRPIQYATVAYRAGRDAYHKQYVAILKELEPHLNKRVEDSWGITQKYINYRFDSMQSMVAMLTHIGNLSNKAKMTVGGRGKGFEWAVYDPETGNIDTSKFDAMIDELISAGILTQAHFDAVQKIWDLNAAMKPDIQRVYRQKYGVFFDEVKPEAFTKTFPDGTKKTYAGGYVPAKTDRDLVYNMGDADAVADVEQTDKDSFPTTDWKFTIKRMERYMKPLDLDLSRQFQHIEAVQRFIHLQPALWDVARLIKSDRIQSAFNSIDPTVLKDMVMPWLERVASQRTGRSTSMPGLDKLIRTMRNRAGMAIMFANLSNTVQQITGFSLALLKVKGSYLRGALRRLVLTSPAKRRKMFDEICERSKLMEQRFKTQIFDLQESMNDVLVNPSKYQKAQSFAKRHAYFMQQYVQNLMDAVVWTASYEQSVAEGVSDAEAVMRADAAVTSTQGGTQPELISKFETGPEFMRVFTQFTNYFNMQFNLNYTEFQKILRDGGWRSNKGKLFTAWVTGLAAPMVVAGLIAQAFSGKLDDDDEDGYADEVGSFVLDALGRGHLSMVPFGNAIAALTINRFDTAVYNDRMLNTPMTGALERAAGSFDLISAMFSEDKDVTGRRIRDAATLLDMIAGLPVSGIAGKVAYAIESMTGVQPNYNFADAVRGSLTGVAAPGNRQK